MKEWKDTMSGNNEKKVLFALENIDFILGVDFVRQHPIGGKFVIDIAFIKERIAIEVDGKTHEDKKQRKSDIKRDIFLYRNGWVVIRVPEKKFFGSGATFYKFLIKEVVEERRKQYESGFLYPIDIPDYQEE